MSKPDRTRSIKLFRRDFLAAGLGAVAAAGLPIEGLTASAARRSNATNRRSNEMNYVTTPDGVEIFYKDWGPKTLNLLSSTMAGH